MGKLIDEQLLDLRRSDRLELEKKCAANSTEVFDRDFVKSHADKNLW